MKKNQNTNKGITLIALVITIIVLLILAGVALATLTGDSGILSNAEKAALQTEISGIEEEASLIYSEMAIGKYTGETDEISMSSIANQLNQKGYTIENVVSAGNVTDITLDNSSLSIPLNGTATIKVTLEAGEEESGYYAVIKGKYYKITETNSGIKVEKTPSEVSSGNTETLTAEVTEGSAVTVGEISGNVINLTAGDAIGTSTITVTYGSFTKTCTVAVKITPTDTSVANADTTLFKTDYGTIEVIWLEGATNKVSSVPNSPANALTASNGEALIPVTFNTATTTWDTLQTTDNKDNNWYEYYPASQVRDADGKLVDSKTSNWANAKTKNDSYFVWIPRYAYRITYYESETSTTPTGYYDGWGMWKAEDGSVKYKLDDGIETVTHNGNEYIVHPAFMGIGSEDLGGGFGTDASGITGFWVAKFEMAGTGTTLNSTYGSASKGEQNIGAQYTSARQATYGYTGTQGTDGNTSFMNSHMMKNSEWGAVAYLTHSQYGRNGHEIDINNNGTTYYRGGGTGTAYITNVAQSTTGNVYGVYDMSGNKLEKTAAFNNTDTNGYFSSYGWTTATGLTTSSSSTKFATKYNNTTSSNSGNVRIYNYGKIGDATKEVNVGGNYEGTSTTQYNNWFSDYPTLANSDRSFFGRGRLLQAWFECRCVLFVQR